MAIIGKIQEKGRYLLVGFVGLALLTFIFSGLQKCDTTTALPIGTIAGEDIDDKKYNDIYEQVRNQDMMNAQQQGREYTEQDQQQTADRAWNQTVTELLLEKEFEALGIAVDDNELNNYLYGEGGFPLMPDIARGFSDSITGQFDPSKLDKFIDERENSKDKEVVSSWKELKENLRKQRQQEKYMQLVGQTVYVTKLEAKEEYMAQKTTKSISFVLRNFRDIEDKDIKITDDEIRKFYEEHKDEKKYEVMAGRDVKYFDITIQASKKDSNDYRTALKSLKPEFRKTTEDSLFIAGNTESKVRLNRFKNPYRSQADKNAKQMTYPANMDTVFKYATPGTVVGPYVHNGMMCLAKIYDYNTQSLSARHILLSAPRTDEKAAAAQKVIADSLATLLKADKTRFEEFVTTYSADQGSKQTGGKYDDFSKDEFVPEFSNFVIDNAIGTIGVVQTDFGFHIIEVLGKTDARFPIMGVIEKEIKPSDVTEKTLRKKANSLLSKLDAKLSQKTDLIEKLALFDTIARREGYFARPVRILDENPKAGGFNTPAAEQKILAFAYDPDAEVGMLCPTPINDQGRYIIAIITSVRTEKGAPSFEDSYDRMRMEAIKDKKAKKFIAQIGKTRNLDQLAKKNGTVVMNAEVSFANPSINGGGYEPEVVGSLFSGLKDKQTTKPLVGNAGVYVIRLNKTTKAPAATNYDMEKTQMLAQARGSIQSTVITGLQKRAEVTDNRVFRQLGIAR